MTSNKLSVKFACFLAQLGIVWRIPYRGTVGTVLGIVWWCVLQHYFMLSYALLCIMSLCAYVLIAIARTQYIDSDPQEIILDECIGIWWALGVYSLPWYWIVGAFLLFRFFDGTKYCGVAWFEKLPGALGILSDDIAAGLLTYGIIQILVYSCW